VEFLLVFDDGSFSEESTSLISEMFLRNPQSVMAKNLQTDVSGFENLPGDQLYIFPGTPATTNISQQNVTGLSGYVAAYDAYTYHFSQVEGLSVPGGNVKIIDPEVFPIASMFSAALVTIHPGAMREVHWQ
jgi:oxalate decarboxylase/phosphoglucose isomerase-like protein (cupin superfamily)